MALEEKFDELTKQIIGLRQDIAASGLGGAKPATKAKGAKAAPADDDDDDEDAKPAAKAKGKAKPKAEEPEHDSDEVGSIFRKAAKIDKPKCKKYLGKVGCEDLAELLTQPELFDAAFDFAEKLIADAEDEDDV